MLGLSNYRYIPIRFIALVYEFPGNDYYGSSLVPKPDMRYTASINISKFAN